jgi:hypothetical protein
MPDDRGIWTKTEADAQAMAAAGGAEDLAEIGGPPADGDV